MGLGWVIDWFGVRVQYEARVKNLARVDIQYGTQIPRLIPKVN